MRSTGALLSMVSVCWKPAKKTVPGLVKNEMSIVNKELEYPYLARYVGRVSGKRMESLSDVKATIAKHERTIERELEKTYSY